MGGQELAIARTGTLPKTLGESSGVAASRSHPGVFWTHNDSGNRASVYAIDSTGSILAEYRVTGARNVDWEDIAAGPCLDLFRDHRRCLYIADLGNNDGSRESGDVYVVPEPAVAADAPHGRGWVSSTETARRLEVRFEGGPRDVEALAVGDDGSLLFVSKGRHGYIIAWHAPAPWGEGPLVPAQLDTLEFAPIQALGRMATGAALSRDGALFAVRTYSEIYRYRINPNTGLIPLEPCFVGAIEPLGEAIDFLEDGRMVLTSEALGSRAGAVHLVSCQ